MNELSWIDFLKKKASKGPGVITGIGDDCAVVSLAKGNYLAKSDLFIEGVHFKRKNMDFKTIGRRAVARVLSDFAAMGGWPLYIGISAGIPKSIPLSAMKEIFAAVEMLENKYSFSLVGGDTARCPKFFLDVWGLGKVQRHIERGGAKAGDHIFVTGKIGCKKFNAPFEPRLKESRYLVRNFKINSMIDITDGLALDLYRMIKESKKGAVIFKETLPLTKGMNDLYRGEDYELLFTIDQAEKNIAGLKKKFYCIGRITPLAKGFHMSNKGVLSPVKVKGYLHF